MSDRRKEKSSRVIELERKLKKLQVENTNLHLGMKSLKKENEYLQAKLKKQEQKHKSHNEHVNSLKDLAAQVSQKVWPKVAGVLFSLLSTNS
jgi:predicted nuclease with TOPRIM domain